MEQSTPSLKITAISLGPDVKEEAIEGDHLIVSVTLSDAGNLIPIEALIDLGATGFAFIDDDFTRS